QKTDGLLWLSHRRRYLCPAHSACAARFDSDAKAAARHDRVTCCRPRCTALERAESELYPRRHRWLAAGRRVAADHGLVAARPLFDSCALTDSVWLDHCLP